MSALWPVQVALMARLKGSTAVDALIGDRIYDGRAPQGTVFPYVVLGTSTSEPYPVFGREGSYDTLEIHVFSRYQGRKEALQIVDVIHAELRVPLSVSGWGVYRLSRDLLLPVDVEGDGTRHVVDRREIRALRAA